MSHNVHVFTSLAPVVQCVSVWSVEAFWSASASEDHGYVSVRIREKGERKRERERGREGEGGGEGGGEGEGEGGGEGGGEGEGEERIKYWFITHSLHH